MHIAILLVVETWCDRLALISSKFKKFYFNGNNIVLYINVQWIEAYTLLPRFKIEHSFPT